jgi:hypothetical protein
MATRGGQVMINKTALEDSVAADVTIGTPVEVRNLCLETWSRGFRVAGIINDAYLVRRISDGWVLPRSFGPDDIRPC